MYGIGGPYYGGITVITAPGVSQVKAQDGVSLDELLSTPTVPIVTMGNLLGNAAQPGKLLKETEVAMNGFDIVYTRDLTVTEYVALTGTTDPFIQTQGSRNTAISYQIQNLSNGNSATAGLRCLNDLGHSGSVRMLSSNYSAINFPIDSFSIDSSAFKSMFFNARGNAGSVIAFAAGGLGQAFTRMVILGNGNVAIGTFATVNPADDTNLLQVHGTETLYTLPSPAHPYTPVVRDATNFQLTQDNNGTIPACVGATNTTASIINGSDVRGQVNVNTVNAIAGVQDLATITITTPFNGAVIAQITPSNSSGATYYTQLYANRVSNTQWKIVATATSVIPAAVAMQFNYRVTEPI